MEGTELDLKEKTLQLNDIGKHLISLEIQIKIRYNFLLINLQKYFTLNRK